MRIDWTDKERNLLTHCGLIDEFLNHCSATDAYRDAAIQLFMQKEIDTPQANCIREIVKNMEKEISFRKNIDEVIDSFLS